MDLVHEAQDKVKGMVPALDQMADRLRNIERNVR